MNAVSDGIRRFAVVPPDRRGIWWVTLIAESIPLAALAVVGATTGRWDALLAPALVAIALSGIVVVLCSRALSRVDARPDLR